MACRVAAQTWVWNLNGDGPWTNSAYWVGPGGYLDGVGHVADFAQVDISQRRFVRVEDEDGLITIGTLLIGDSNQPYTFSNKVGSTTWLFADSDGLSDIVVSNAYSTDKSRSHRIDGTIALSNDLRVTTLQAGSHSDLWFWER